MRDIIKKSEREVDQERFLGQSSTLATYFPKMAKFSVFGKFFRFWKKKVFHYWKKTSGKQVFQPRKKSDYVGVSKTKTNFYCIFFGNFWPWEKIFDRCVFHLWTHLSSIFRKNKIKKLKTLGNRLNHQFHYNTCVNL